MPNARFVGLNNRTEAVQKLALGLRNDDAIDAYASDEVMLLDMLHQDLPRVGLHPDQYAVLPPLYGYSREEYVVLAYNTASTLIEEVERWLDTAAGRQAVEDIRPTPSLSDRLLSWSAWGSAWGNPMTWLLWGLPALACLFMAQTLALLLCCSRPRSGSPTSHAQQTKLGTIADTRDADATAASDTHADTERPQLSYSQDPTSADKTTVVDETNDEDATDQNSTDQGSHDKGGNPPGVA